MLANKKTLRPAVFLDRDGTINEQMGYINHVSRFHILPGVIEAVSLFNKNNIPVIIVTNQSGLARGYFPESLLSLVHDKMIASFTKEDVFIDGIYICPHHPEAKEERFRKTCTCRKPKTGLLEQAARELNLDLKKSFMVGDRWSDIKCGEDAGATSVLVLTGYGRGDLEYISPQQDIQPSYIAEDLGKAASWIMSRIQQETR